MRLEGIAELGNRFHFTRVQRVYAGTEHLPRNHPHHTLKRTVELQVIACGSRAEEITGFLYFLLDPLCFQIVILVIQNPLEKKTQTVPEGPR